MEITYAQAVGIARDAHDGQTDKTGMEYIHHPLAVAHALAPFGAHAQIAGVLHDVIEDTGWSADALLEAGVPPRAVRAVQAVSRDKATGQTYQQWVESLVSAPRAADDLVEPQVLAQAGLDAAHPVPLAVLVKLADNLHNSLPSRALPGAEGERMGQRYARARAALEAGLPEDVVARVRAGFPERIPS